MMLSKKYVCTIVEKMFHSILGRCKQYCDPESVIDFTVLITVVKD